MSPDK